MLKQAPDALATTAAGLLLLALAPLPTHAQSAGQPDTPRRDTTIVELPELQVVASILPSVGPAVGSGTPARAEVILRDEIRAARPRLLTDALATQAGFSLYDDLGSRFKTTLVTRGFAASPVVGLPQGVSVFLDGVPVNEPDAGQVNFGLLPLEPHCASLGTSSVRPLPQSTFRRFGLRLGDRKLQRDARRYAASVPPKARNWCSNSPQLRNVICAAPSDRCLPPGCDGSSLLSEAASRHSPPGRREAARPAQEARR